MQKIQSVQALRGIAVLSVVFYHLLTFEKSFGGSKTILPNVFQFGMFGVDLFFIISGFVMFIVTKGKFQIPKQAFVFLYRRVSRIYPIYWFYTILLLIVFSLKPAGVVGLQFDQIKIISSFLLIPSHTAPILAVGWTLIHEMYFYIVYFFILILVGEKRLINATLLWGTIVVLLKIFVGSHSPILRLISHPLTIEFICGCILAAMYHKIKITIKPLISFVLAGLILLVSIYGFLLYQNITGRIEPSYWWRILIYGVPAFVMFYCLTNAERNGFDPNSLLIHIGNASYSIYLSHILTLQTIGRIWKLFSIDSVVDNIVMIPVAVSVVITVGIVSYNIIEKPVLRLSRKSYLVS